MPARKVIITCAVTGSAHTPTMSPNLPYTVEDVVDQSVAAVEAGAAIIHLHARDPRDGRPTAEPAVFIDYLKGIKDSTDAVVSITSGGGTGMTVDERLRVIYETRPELCTLNLGTFNYGSFPMIPKYAGSWKFDWEEAYLESTRVEPFVSTFADIETMLTDVRKQTGSRFEYEAYDIGHLYTLAYYLEAGLVEPPIFLQTIMGVMGGIGATVEHLAHMKSTADRLLGDAYEWSVLGAGRHQFEMITASAVMGLRTSASASRTASSSGAVSSPSRTPSRSRRSDGSSPSCPSISRHRRRLVRSSGSRVSTRSAGERRPRPAGRGPDGHGRRHGRHRWRLGRPLPASRLRRRGVGPGTRCRGSPLRAPGHRLAFAGEARAEPRREPGPAALGGDARGGSGRHRLRAGVVARGAGRQGRSPGDDRPAGRPGRRGRVEHVRPVDVRHGGRAANVPAGSSSGTRSTRRT